MNIENAWINITGNWHMGTEFVPGIVVSEPEPLPEGNRFSQTLELPAGQYELRFVYYKDRDHAPCKALFYHPEHLPLYIDGEECVLSFTEDVDPNVMQGTIKFKRQQAGAVMLEISVLDTRMLETCLRTANALPESGFFAAGREYAKEVAVVRGIPFWAAHHSRRLSMWDGARYLGRPEPEGELVRPKAQGPLALGGARVGRIYFLGMTHSYDVANGSWYSKKGDKGFSHFIGDALGKVRLNLVDGSRVDIPLIMGLNVWYGMPWDVLWDQGNFPLEGQDQRALDSTFFGGVEEEREAFHRDVGVEDGVRRSGAQHNQRYLFALDVGGLEVFSMEVVDGEDIYGRVIVSGVTLEIEGGGNQSLTPLPVIARPSTGIRVHQLQDILNGSYAPAIERLQRALYTHTDELPRLSAPEIPEGYFGPRYDFRGSNEALLAATYLYWNGPECAAYIGRGGMTCSSSTARWRTTAYMSGMGVRMRKYPPYDGLSDFLKQYAERSPEEFPIQNAAWSRGIGELLRESMAFGYDKCVDSYLDWLDQKLFEEAYPPHWNRIVGQGTDSEGFHGVLVGDIEETGNRENDGHGICMWGRYMMWLWKGRDRAWNEAHFNATRAAVEWLAWQLDVDRIRPGRRVDILYTESECAHGDYDFYSSFNCLHGLKLSLRMAAQLGRWDEYARWSALYERLAKGIYEHLRDDSELGPVWHTEERTDWQEHAHKLAHIQLATDGDTYTPLEDYGSGYDRLYLEVDKASYRYLMKDGDYDSLRNYGYGQGMMMQAALLLDEMKDAEGFLNMMVTHNYLPRMERWVSPEGIITHSSGKFYVPVNGYMGQDSHAADSTKAVRLMLGVDDNRLGCLHLVPRFPAGWERCEIADYPVLIGDQRGSIGYVLERAADSICMSYTLSEAYAVDMRLGPLPANAVVSRVDVDGRGAAFDSYRSGDSKWIWVRGLRGSSARVCAEFSQTEEC